MKRTQRKKHKPQKVKIKKNGARFQFFTGIVVAMLFATTMYQVVNQPIRASDANNKIRVVSYNVLISSSAANIQSDIQNIIIDQEPDIITLQELYSDSKRAKVMEKFACSTYCPYGGFSVNGKGREELVILWKRDRFSPIYKGSVKTASSWKEHGRYHGPLYFNFAKLQDVTNGERQIIVATTHAPSLVDRDDNGRPNWNKLPKRVAAYKKHMERIKDKIKFWKSNNTKTPIFFTGDFNVNYRKDVKVKNTVFPYAKFKSVGGSSSWQTSGFAKANGGATTFAPKPAIAGQPKNRLIDYVFKIDDGAGLRIDSASIYSQNLHSDHRAAVATYRYQ